MVTLFVAFLEFMADLYVSIFNYVLSTTMMHYLQGILNEVMRSSARPRKINLLNGFRKCDGGDV